jgi:hypothetical protein
MSRLQIACLVLGLNLISQAAIGQEQPVEAFRSETGRFAAEFPGVPKERSEGEGEKKVTKFTLATPSMAYQLHYIDIDPAIVAANDPQKILTTYRSGYRKGVEFEGDREVALPDKTPGRSYSLTAPDGALVRESLFLAGNRLYMVYVVALAKEPLSSEPANRFFESFRVTQTK